MINGPPRFHGLRHYQLQNISIPQISQVNSIDYVMDLLIVQNGCENNLLIPLSDWQWVIIRLENQKFVGNVVNQEYFLS